jgi:TolA-binding protein
MMRLRSVALTAVAIAGTTTHVFSADLIFTRDGIVHTGEVARVDAEGVFLKLPVGELKLFKTDIARVQIDKPAAYDTAVAALKSQKFSEALNHLKPLVERYSGLSVPWIEQAMLQLGEAYLGVGDSAAAKRTYDAFAKLYPGSPRAAAVEVKYARVLVAQKDCARATELLKKFLEPRLKSHFLTDEQTTAVAEALVLLGDCQRAAGLLNDALDNFLMVLTLFNTDDERTTEAKYKAAQTFEQLGNWKRARGAYQELLAESPASTFASDARSRLAALAKDHPE